MPRHSSFVFVKGCAVLLLALLPIAVHGQIDFTGVGTAVTLSDADRFFAARADRVNRYNACRGKVLGKLFGDEQDFPVVAIAKLEIGGQCPGENQDNITEVRQALLQSQPYGEVTVLGQTLRADWELGTSSDKKFGPIDCTRKGEFDVAAAGLLRLVYRYPDKLGRDVYNHVLRDLLAPKLSGPHQESNRFVSICGVPFPESENHLLLIETSRYLTNQLLGIDNAGNGYDAWILTHLREFLKNDFSEYNARPYQNYSMAALHNLYDFACDPRFVANPASIQSCTRVKVAAHMVLDYVSAKFAVSSNGLRRYAPYRRKRAHFGTALYDSPPCDCPESDPQTFRFMMLAGMTKPPALGAPYHGGGGGEMEGAAASTYRVPDLILDLILNKWRNSYYQRIRHAAAEIYWSSPQFLITAGGVWVPSSHSGQQCQVTIAGNGISPNLCGDEFNDYDDVGLELNTTLMPTNAGVDANQFIQIYNGPDRGQNLCVAPQFACGLSVLVPDRYLAPGCFTSVDGGGRATQNGPWWFINFSGSCNGNLGFYVAVYNGIATTIQGMTFDKGGLRTVFTGPAQLRLPGLFEVVPSDGLDFATFQQRVLNQNGSRTFQSGGVNEYVTVAGRRIDFIPYTSGPNYSNWAIVSIDGRPESTIFPLAEGDIINSCEHIPCQPGDGRNGYITIDNPAWGKRLILDFHDPANPQRTEIDLKAQNSNGAVARTIDNVDVFWVAQDGTIGSNWWYNTIDNYGAWHKPFPVAAPQSARLLAPVATPVAALARYPNHLDTFWVAPDGSVLSNWWDAGANHGAWNQPVAIAPPNSARWNSPVAAVARTPDHLDVFWISPNGSIATAWWDGNFNNGRWNPPFLVAPPNAAGPESGLAAVGRTANHLDVFWVDAAGTVSTNWWDGGLNGAKWNAPFAIAPPNSARINSPLAVVARTPNHLDVFWIDNNAGIASNWWDVNFNNGHWNSPFPVAPANSASAASALSAVARFRDHLDVFWVGGDGSVATNWWDANFNNGRWNTPFTVTPPGRAAVTSPLSAVARTPDRLDLFWVGSNGRVASAWWGWDAYSNSVHWNTAVEVAPSGAAVARLESSDQYAAARMPEHIDLFWLVSDGEVFSSWWDSRVNNGRWNQVFSLFTLPPGPPAPPKLNSAQNEGDPASLGGPPPGIKVGGRPRVGNSGGLPSGENEAGQKSSPELDWLARPNSPVAAVARTPDHLDVFWINKNGQIWSDWGDSTANHFWNTQFVAVTPPGSAGPKSGLTALARRPDLLDVFWIGNDGGVWSNGYNNGRWNVPLSISPGPPSSASQSPASSAQKPPTTNSGAGVSPAVDRAPRPNSPLAAVARTPDHLDVFWVNKEGQVWSNWWDGNVNRGAWNAPFNINIAPPPQSSGTGKIPQNVHSTQPVQANIIARLGETLPVLPAAGPTASPDSGIAAVARTPDHLDVFWVSNDGLIWTNWWDQWVNNARWNTPFNINAPPTPSTPLLIPPSRTVIGTQNGQRSVVANSSLARQGLHTNLAVQTPQIARPNSPVVAAARTPEHLDVFWIGGDGAIWTTWWDARVNGGKWNVPFPVSAANAAAADSRLSVLTRAPEHIDVFWTAPDGSLMSNWWDRWINRAQWNTPFRIWP